MKLTGYIEHCIVKPDTTISDIESLCTEAIEYGFPVVCIPPLFVKKAKALTITSNVKVATVIGFPFGYSAIEAKVAEIVLAIIDGADELQMVINTGAVKNKDWQFLANEINTVMPIIRGKDKLISIIIETRLLTNEEIITCCDIYGAAGVDFIKAGTGYAGNDTTVEIIQLICKHVATLVKVKADSGVNNYSFVKQLINAGAHQVSCNNGIQLVQETLQQN